MQHQFISYHLGIEAGVEITELRLDRPSSNWSQGLKHNWSQGLKHCITSALFLQLFLKHSQFATHQLLLLPQTSQFIHQFSQLVDTNLGTWGLLLDVSPLGLLLDVSPLSALSAFVHICSNSLASPEVGALLMRPFLAESLCRCLFSACVLAGSFNELHGGFLQDQ